MSQVPASEQVYYRDKYWNDHAIVLEYFRRLIGNGRKESQLLWPQYFLKYYLRNQARAKALFINCGNGWVERELFDLGCFKEALAFDYSPELIKQAEAAKQGRRISYLVADCNQVEFDIDQFDLVLNVAALHHVQYLDRLMRIMARSLKADGLCVNFDYVGPHRNQYDAKTWAEINCANDALPRGLRAAPLKYPHLPTMLLHDPTEAIHSELILDTFERYFYTLERADLNGAIAYQIMHNNHPLFAECGSSRAAVDFLVQLDELYSLVGESQPLFSFWVGKPRKAVFDQQQQLSSWTAEEQEREARAASNGGRYY